MLSSFLVNTELPHLLTKIQRFWITLDTVNRYVGMEPSGRKFNDMELDYNKQPHNPMVGYLLTNPLGRLPLHNPLGRLPLHNPLVGYLYTTPW